MVTVEPVFDSERCQTFSSFPHRPDRLWGSSIPSFRLHFPVGKTASECRWRL